MRVPQAPENVIFKSREELHNKLAVGAKQIQEGKALNADNVMNQLGNEYGF